MSGRLEHRVALIIGAARGIGKGIAQRFVEEGAKIVIGDREIDIGEETARGLGGRERVRFVAADIARKEAAEKAVSAAVEHFGGLDILVQNAGIFPWTLIENIEPE